jgi:prolyl-tRNA synthetase
LAERLCIRPTSETLFCEHFAKIITSYRDLPLLYNQWCSVVRWEKTTRPFLRTTEFWWQEGHTMHETAQDAMKETEQQLECYARLCEEYLAIPVIKGKKTDKEKFAGAECTYTIEAMMHDGKALQSGTSHYFGDGFARAFNITFQSRENTQLYPHQTSWGLSTRIIGAIIMTHGDDNGLVLPPAVAPIQAVVLPIAQHKPGVLDAAKALLARISKVCRVKMDDSDNSPGWKFAEYEMKGVPLRIELGPKDIEQNQCVVVTRHDRTKHIVPLEELAERIPVLLDDVRKGIYKIALENRESKTYTADSMEEVLQLAATKPGFIKTMWCEDPACEQIMKDQAGLTARCMPFEQEKTSQVCPVCNRPAKVMVVWGKAY